MYARRIWPLPPARSSIHRHLIPGHRGVRVLRACGAGSHHGPRHGGWRWVRVRRGGRRPSSDPIRRRGAAGRRRLPATAGGDIAARTPRAAVLLPLRALRDIHSGNLTDGK